MPPEAVDLASRLLQYSPSLRCTAVSSSLLYLDEITTQEIPGPRFLTSTLSLWQLEAMAHPFFDELREPNVRLPNGRPLPPLFNFKQEVRPSIQAELFKPGALDLPRPPVGNELVDIKYNAHCEL